MVLHRFFRARHRQIWMGHLTFSHEAPDLTQCNTSPPKPLLKNVSLETPDATQCNTSLPHWLCWHTGDLLLFFCCYFYFYTGDLIPLEHFHQVQLVEVGGRAVDDLRLGRFAG